MCFQNNRNLNVMLVFVLAGLVIIFYCVFDSAVTHNASVSIGFRVKPTLRSVVVISRHGNRAPFSTFPKDQYKPNNTAYWPFGPNQLTLKGRSQMYSLGIRIRDLYNGFLDEYYYKDKFKAFSTEVDRTMMSAQLFLAGLFPPKGFQVWNDKLKWQPIPVFQNIWDHSDDAETLCPLYKKHIELNLAKFEQDEKLNNTLFLDSLQPYTGLEMSNNITGRFIYILSDCLMSAYDEGLPLPVWAQKIYPEIVNKRMKLLSVFGLFNVLKYIEGPLFQNIIELLETNINGKSDMKMYYFSGHDKTLFGLQSIMGIPFTEFINTGSSLILELHEDLEAKRHFVEVVYIDGGTEHFDLSTVSIPVCEHPCDFYLLKNLTKGYCDFTDYIKDCQIDVISM